MSDCEPQDCAKMRGLLVACGDCARKDERERGTEYREKMMEKMWNDAQTREGGDALDKGLATERERP